MGGYSHAQSSIQHPHKRHQPPPRSIAPHALPSEDEPETKAQAGHERGEEHEDQGDGVVEEL